MSEPGNPASGPDPGRDGLPYSPPPTPPAATRPRAARSAIAAAAVLVVAGLVGAYLLGVAHGHSSAPRSAQLQLGSAATSNPPRITPRPVPADAVLLSRCLSTVEAKHRPATAGAQVRTVFADNRGYLVWIGNRSFDKQCGYRWDGSADPVSDSSAFGESLAPGYSDFGTVDLRGKTTIVAGGQTVRYVQGVVARGVQQLRVRWFDGPTVAAVVRDQYFFARSVEPTTGTQSPSSNCVLEAYGSNGELLRQQDCD